MTSIFVGATRSPSGVIEGACRHLVKDRVERSGMRWTLEGALSILHLRAAFQSDHWEAMLLGRMAVQNVALFQLVINV